MLGLAELHSDISEAMRKDVGFQFDLRKIPGCLPGKRKSSLQSKYWALVQQAKDDVSEL